MGKVLKYLRPPPLSPPPVLNFQELHVKGEIEALKTPGDRLFRLTTCLTLPHTLLQYLCVHVNTEPLTNWITI